MRWTKGCFKLWISGIPNVTKNEDTYWSCYQTFFTGEDAEENRKEYDKQEKELIQRLTNNQF